MCLWILIIVTHHVFFVCVFFVSLYFNFLLQFFFFLFIGWSVLASSILCSLSLYCVILQAFMLVHVPFMRMAWTITLLEIALVSGLSTSRFFYTSTPDSYLFPSITISSPKNPVRNQKFYVISQLQQDVILPGCFPSSNVYHIFYFFEQSVQSILY